MCICPNGYHWMVGEAPTIITLENGHMGTVREQRGTERRTGCAKVLGHVLSTIHSQLGTMMVPHWKGGTVSKRKCPSFTACGHVHMS